MILDTDYIKDKKPIKTKLELAKPNGQIIGVIVNAHNKNMNLLFNGIGELNFTVPYQIENGNTVVDIKSDYEALEHDLNNFVDGDKKSNNDIDYVVNPQATNIKELMYVKVTYLNGQHQWFVIDSISDTVEDSDNMDVVAFTTEYELKRKRIYTEIDLGTTTISESIGTILSDTGWKLGGVDASLDEVYRNIVIDNGDKYSAIMEIAESFGAILEWDSSQKTVDIDIIENKMKNKGLIINEKNMLNGLTRQRTTDEIITRMYVFGEDDLSIESVNPTGNRYIEDFSYFIYPFERDENKNVIEHSFYMSDELAHAMLDLSELSKTILPQIQDKQQSIVVKNQKLSATTIEYYDLETQVSLIKGLLQIAKATNDTVLQAQREAELVDAEANFENIKYKKETLESEISALQNDIFQLQKRIDATSFTPKLQKELAPFIIEGEFRDDRYIDADELYQDAKTHLTKNNLPRTIIEADLQTVLLDPENNEYRDKIVVGDLATVKYDKLDIEYQEPIVEIEIDLDETNIQLTLSDNNSALDSVDRLVDIIYDTATTTATMEGKSHKWDTIIDVQSEVDKIRNEAIHTVNQRIYAGVNEDITIGSDGLVARNPDFPDEMLILQSGVLALSQDNGATWKTAITPDGIMADTIIGRLLLGNELVISNDTGTFVIDQDGITANADMIRIMSGDSSTPTNLIDSWNSMLNTMSEFSDDGVLNEYEKNQLEKQYNHESNAYSSMVSTYQNVMGPETTDNPYSQEFDDFILAYTNLKKYLTNTVQADGYAILDATNRANTSKIDPNQYDDIVNAFNNAKEKFMLQIPMDYSSTQIRQTKYEVALEYLKSGEVINQINLSDEGISIDGSKITIDGNTTFKDDLIMDSGKITSKDGQSVVIDLNAGTIELLKPLVIKGDVVLTSNEVAEDIVNTKKQYGQTTDPNQTPTTWYDEPLPWVDGLYIWEKEIHYYRNGKQTETIPVNITGAQGKQGEKGNDGLPGKDGVGLKSTSVTYTSSSNGTTAPTSGWTSTIPTVSPGDYQWTKTIWTYTDNTTETGYSVAHIGKDGNDGTNGVAGKDGTKLLDTIITYAKSTNGTTPPGTGWTSSVPSTNPGDYIWTKTVWEYDDNTDETGYSVGMIGETGATGKQGPEGKQGIQGVSITKVDVEYAQNSSSTSAPTSGWSTNAPTWKNGQYIWSRTKTTYSSGNPTYSKPACITGQKGSVGGVGNDGKGISSIVEQYYLSDSKETRTGGAWTATAPKWEQGKYMWTRSQIKWINPTDTTYTDPIVDTAWEAMQEGTKGIGLADKTEVLSGTEIYTDKADDSVVHVEIDGKSYQGKNFLVDSRRYIDNNLYNMATYQLSEKPVVGKTYTFTLKGSLGSDRRYFAIYNSGGRVNLGALRYDSDSGYYIGSFVWKNETARSDGSVVTANDTYINVYQIDSVSTSNSQIEWSQLEVGEKFTNREDYETHRPSPEHPSEIHSLNDFDVVSQKSEGGTIDGIEVGGRNLLKGTQNFTSALNLESSGVTTSVNTKSDYKGEAIKVLSLTFSAETSDYVRFNNAIKEANTDYTFSCYIERIGYSVISYSFYVNGVKVNTTTTNRSRWVKVEFTFTSSADISKYHYIEMKAEYTAGANGVWLSYPKLEKGNKATDWTPAPEDITESDNHPFIDKINLSLSEPLRSVGDVKDRLFRDDSDGLWKIERNITVINLSEKTNWSIYRDSSYEPYDKIAFRLGDRLPENKDWTITNLNSHFNQGLALGQMNSIGDITGATNYSQNWDYMNLYIVTERRVASTASAFRNFLTNEANQGRPVIHQYAVENPAIETLDQELQDKLNNLCSFQDSNYVYTVINNKTDIISENLKPTLHATFKGGGWYSRWKTDNKFERQERVIDDITQSVRETIEEQPAQWQGDIDTNVQNVIGRLTEMQTELNGIHNELTGKANQEETLNSEEIENIINEVLERYPDLLSLKQHFRFDGVNGISMSATDASNQALETSFNIKNDGARIYVNGAVVAYFTETETLTSDLNVERTAYLGNHAITRFNGYENNVYDENKNITVFAWAPRKVED